MANEQICQWLLESILRAKAQHNVRLLAYVFMPDHVHLLIHPDGENYQIALILKSIKQGVSRRAANAGIVQGALWEPGGGHDRNIFCESARINAIHYIHMNPVRKSLTEDILDYRWSSARAYHREVADIEIDRMD